MKPSEHLVNLYWPVVLFHWSRLPVVLSLKQVSNLLGSSLPLLDIFPRLAAKTAKTDRRIQ
jgi:hypothetical protein